MSSRNTAERVAIIGAGIVGLAHAWLAAESGHQVTVIERSPRASGASIRNFGMIWPIGQPHGELYQTAIRSRARWLRLGMEAGIVVDACGSVHAAHRDDEQAVLEEFAAVAPQLGVACQMLSPAQVLQKAPLINPDGLLCGLYSPTELCVNPTKATRTLPDWLANRYGVRFHFGVLASEVVQSAGRPRIVFSDGTGEGFDRVLVCGGADFQTLFPEVLQSSGLVACKLQMLALAADSLPCRLGTHVAGGLTLRHYRIFEICPSLQALRLRIARETPELDRYGIHVMASQNDLGELILGDSHEYGSQIEPFDDVQIDEWILRELKHLLQLPTWKLSRRWHGIYAKHPDLPVYQAQPIPRVHIFTGTGGAGMTMSFGLAEDFWSSVQNQ